MIYDAGDLRTAWLAFWKGTAIFQFGVVCVFFAPILYHNENQPDANLRLLQAGGGNLALIFGSYFLGIKVIGFCFGAERLDFLKDSRDLCLR